MLVDDEQRAAAPDILVHAADELRRNRNEAMAACDSSEVEQRRRFPAARRTPQRHDVWPRIGSIAEHFAKVGSGGPRDDCDGAGVEWQHHRLAFVTLGWV